MNNYDPQGNSDQTNMKQRQHHHQQQRQQQEQLFSISAQELKEKLDSQQPIMVLDIGEQERYAKRHIPGSACAVCNETTKETVMPKLPKDIEIVLVNDDEGYARNVTVMMHQGGFFNVYYLEGGLDSWTGSFEESRDSDITPLELKHSLEKRNRKDDVSNDGGDNVLLLDVRTPEEYSEWHIEGSINIPLQELSSKQAIERISKDKEIVTICSHGNRSKVAKFIFQRYGYRVKSLEGGMSAWTTAFEDSSPFDLKEGEDVALVQVRRIGKGCMSYVLAEKNGEAAVFDPVFPIQHYVDVAARYNAKITKIYDTHQHADHISGAKTLSDKTGAKVFVSAYEGYEVEGDSQKSVNLIHDADTHIVSNITIQAIHTPGHTAGSFSFLIGNEFLITGDTLFVDGVGRPDLRDKATEFAFMLYDSLHGKILNLPEKLLILPAHINRGDTTKSGELVAAPLYKVNKNQQLLKLVKDEFVKQITSRVRPTPANYRQIVAINKQLLQIPEADAQALEMGPNRCSVSSSSSSPSSILQQTIEEQSTEKQA
jgi:glyoxylase-like metal-dependent hydrolase (beta-lactamase superfamily II)/rhodanese-related sulfurtransferase